MAVIKMRKDLCRKKHKKIQESGEKVARILKIIGQPQSSKILMAIKESNFPLTWREISRVTGITFYNHSLLSELYKNQLIKPQLREGELACGWVLANDLVNRILFLVELHVSLPNTNPDRSVLKLEKIFNEMRDNAKKVYAREEIARLADECRYCGDDETYDVLTRLLAEDLLK